MEVTRHDVYTIIHISQNKTDICDVIKIDNFWQSYNN